MSSCPFRSRSVLALALLASVAFGQNQVMQVSVVPPSGYLEIPASSQLVPGSITIEAWMTYNDSGLPAGWIFPTIGRKNFSQGVAEWFLRVDAGNSGARVLRLWLGGSGGTVNVSYPFAVGAFLSWTHVAATYDGTTARLYLNGTQVAQATGTGPLVDLGAPTRIGAGDTAVGAANELWNGNLDDVRIWSVALTQAQIAAGMFQRITTAAGLNASYLLDGNGIDATGNGNHGTIVGTPGFPSLPSPGPSWQTNSAGSSLSLNGILASGLGKAVTGVCVGAQVVVTSGGTTGLPWEAAYNTVPSVAAGAPGSFTTSGGQIINLDLTAPTLFLFGGLGPALTPYGGPFTVSFAAPPGGTTVSFQQLNVDPGNPEGFSLSQAAQLEAAAYTPPASPTAGPVGDDTQVALNVGCVSLYGRNFSTIWVQSNGRLTFGAGNTGFTTTAALFASNPPSYGCWTDFNPALGGTITITQPAPGVLDATWNGVMYFGTTTPNTFSLQLDTVTGVASIIGLGGLAAGTGNMLIGLSGGNVVAATDAGATIFSPGGLGSNGVTTDGTAMLYAIGTRGSVTSGINRIDFIPNAFNNYDWVSQ